MMNKTVSRGDHKLSKPPVAFGSAVGVGEGVAGAGVVEPGSTVLLGSATVIVN